jgi:N-acetylmuramoyl-L-alanine amidase
MNPYTVSSTHRLLEFGKAIPFEPLRSPTGDAMPVRRFLVVHFTAGWSLDSTVEFWRTAQAKGAGAHLVIDRDGYTAQCRPFNQTAGHAGVSKWKDPNTGKMYHRLNSCSIGIELCNCGSLVREKYPPGMGALSGYPIPRMEARHKNGGPVKKWEVYSTIQLYVARQIAQTLVARYRLDDVIGHDDVSPNRKEDPGPAFPMATFREDLGFSPDYP